RQCVIKRTVGKGYRLDRRMAERGATGFNQVFVGYLCFGDHRFRIVDADIHDSRHEPHQAGGHLAVAKTNFEDALAWPDTEALKCRLINRPVSLGHAVSQSAPDLALRLTEMLRHLFWVELGQINQ